MTACKAAHNHRRGAFWRHPLRAWRRCRLGASAWPVGVHRAAKEQFDAERLGFLDSPSHRLGRRLASTATPVMASTASWGRSAAPATTDRSSCRCGTRRWRPSWHAGTRSSRGARASACATSGPGAIHLLNGLYDAQHGSPAGGRDRRTAGAVRAGRRLPAGGRPADAVQGRGARVPADGFQPRPDAPPGRPGDAHRASPSGRSPA